MCLKEIIGHENYKTKKIEQQNKNKFYKCKHAVCAKL